MAVAWLEDYPFAFGSAIIGGTGMSGTVMKIVECIRNGKVFAAYPLAYGLTLGPSATPDLIREAKECLIREGHVKPPFDFTGISFRVLDA